MWFYRKRMQTQKWLASAEKGLFELEIVGFTSVSSHDNPGSVLLSSESPVGAFVPVCLQESFCHT